MIGVCKYLLNLKKICETNDDMRPTYPQTSYTARLSILNSTIIDELMNLFYCLMYAYHILPFIV